MRASPVDAKMCAAPAPERGIHLLSVRSMHHELADFTTRRLEMLREQVGPTQHTGTPGHTRALAQAMDKRDLMERLKEMLGEKVGQKVSRPINGRRRSCGAQDTPAHTHRRSCCTRPRQARRRTWR
jgi:hypothetical protein